MFVLIIKKLPCNFVVPMSVVHFFWIIKAFCLNWKYLQINSTNFDSEFKIIIPVLNKSKLRTFQSVLDFSYLIKNGYKILHVLTKSIWWMYGYKKVKTYLLDF